MRKRLLAGFILFVLAVTVGLEVPLGLILQSRQHNSAIGFVRRASSGLAVLVGDALDHAEPSRAKEVAARYLRQIPNAGVIVVSGTRLLVRVGDANPAELRAPEIASAIRSVGSTTLSGKTSVAGTEVLYAVALADRADVTSGRERSVVVLSQPYSVEQHRITTLWLELSAFGAAVVLAAAALGWMISASMIRPLRRIEAAVTAIGEGDLATRAPTEHGASELRALASAVNAMAGRLDHLLAAQRSFAANASHQLRTPLTALRLRLEQVREQAPRGGTVEIDAALEEVRRLSRIIGALLELARDEAVPPERVAVDVDEVIAERLDAWRPLAEEQSLSLSGRARSDARPEPLYALVGASILDQVLDNLLANAFDATPPGGHVRVEAVGQGSFIEIHVVDDGHGLAPGEHELAFDRFWRGSDSRPGGSGLGLAIVDHLLRISGGSAELRARANGGTEAIVRVPVAEGTQVTSTRREPSASEWA